MTCFSCSAGDGSWVSGSFISWLTLCSAGAGGGKDAGETSGRGIRRQMTKPMMAKPTTTEAGMINFFNPNVTVISFDVRGFLSGSSRSVVGIPFSIFLKSERRSSAF